MKEHTKGLALPFFLLCCLSTLYSALASGGSAWTEMITTNPPSSRHSFTTVLRNGEMVVFGGELEDNALSRGLYILQIAKAEWREISINDTIDYPSSRKSHSAVYVEDENSMIIFGGQDSTGNVLNDVWEFNFDTEQWTELTPQGDFIPSRFGHTSIYKSTEQKMYVFGGDVEEGLLTFSLDSDSWEALTPEGVHPTFRVHHSAALASDENSFFIFGGENETDYKSDVFRFDFDNSSWTELSEDNKGDSPSPRSGHYMGITSGDSLIIFGGIGDEDAILEDVWMFDTISATWRQLETPIPLSGRHSGGAVVFDEHLIVFGGSDNNEDARSDVWRLDLRTQITSSTTGDFVVDDDSESMWNSASAFFSSPWGIVITVVAAVLVLGIIILAIVFIVRRQRERNPFYMNGYI